MGSSAVNAPAQAFLFNNLGVRFASWLSQNLTLLVMAGGRLPCSSDADAAHVVETACF